MAVMDSNNDPRAEKAIQTKHHYRMPFFLLPIFFLSYWATSLAVLWWAYDISPLIRGGYYDRYQALRIVTKMGLVITVLTGFVWLFRMRRDIRPPILRGAWAAAWQTGLILIGYSALILARLQFGKFSTPLADKAFLPILGSVNSHFFSEAGSLAFIFMVTPTMGCVSGILYFLQSRTRQLSLNPD
jgi:hypothetical protein